VAQVMGAKFKTGVVATQCRRDPMPGTAVSCECFHTAEAAANSKLSGIFSFPNVVVKRRAQRGAPISECEYT
jgi:hypothetical protein